MGSNIVGLFIGLGLAVITIVLILWGNRSSKASQAQVPAEKAIESHAEPPAPPAAKMPDVMQTEDDLVIIEGIGPKVADVLKQNGVRTFAQLAATPVSTLEKILLDNGLRFMKPDSWPEQGRLAAAGQMDELKALQNKLVAGK